MGFKSSETVLLPKKKCVEIQYESRGVPVSWGHSGIKPTINEILKSLISDQKNDISDQYKVSTKKVMSLLNASEGQEKMISICEKCSFKTECQWGKYSKERKIARLFELYNKVENCDGKTKKC
jgi:hypothetical protein